MPTVDQTIKQIASCEFKNFDHQFVGCIVLSHDHKILVQKRGNNWHSFPGFLSTFGGRVVADELPLDALIRELHEELGANVLKQDVISLGAITEAITNHQDLIHVYFWHDVKATITGCYEGEIQVFGKITEVLVHPNITDDLNWGLRECRRLKLLD